MSDSEYTDSEYEYEDENDYDYLESVIYSPEEHSLTRYNITICELYNARIHGSTNAEVLQHYLVYSRYKKYDTELINDDVRYIQNAYANFSDKSHDIYTNYEKIISNNNYIKPEISECIYLNDGHCVAIIKTIWIKLIQRKWKNILKKRENAIRQRCQPKSLQYREETGKWPNECYDYPILKGMLYMLKN
jgi:hypothetical protein